MQSPVTPATVSFPDGTGYLDGTKDNYKIITVQDTSIIINSKDNVSADTAVTDSNYDPDRSVSIVLGFRFKRFCLYY